MFDDETKSEWVERFKEAFHADRVDAETFLANCGPIPAQDAAEVREYGRLFAGMDTMLQLPGDAGTPPEPKEEFPQQFGRYTLLDRIGEGGMGVLYLARSELHPKLVIKKMTVKTAATRSGPLRFDREACHLRELHHPNIVPYIDHGDHQGCPFLATEFVDGKDLNKVAVPQSPEQVKQVVQRFQKLALALDAVHDKRILHRDIKPANVMVGPTGEPCLVDFGLARHDHDQKFTSSEKIVGTIPYMAPEIFHGKEATAQSDIYSLGATLYFALTGRAPFVENGDAALRRAIQVSAPQSLRQFNPLIDSRLEAICVKCLEKIPEQRYDSASDLAKELERWLAGTRVLTVPQHGVVRDVREVVRDLFWLNPRTRKVLVWSGMVLGSIALVMLLVSGIAWALTRGNLQATTTTHKHIAVREKFAEALGRLSSAPDQGKFLDELELANQAAMEFQSALPQESQHVRTSLGATLEAALDNYYCKLGRPNPVQVKEVEALLLTLTQLDVALANRKRDEWQFLQRKPQPLFAETLPSPRLSFTTLNPLGTPWGVQAFPDAPAEDGDIELRCVLDALPPGGWARLALTGEAPAALSAIHVAAGDPPLALAGYSDGRVYVSHPWSGIHHIAGDMGNGQPIVALSYLRKPGCAVAADSTGKICVLSESPNTRRSTRMPAEARILRLYPRPGRDELVFAAMLDDTLQWYSWNFADDHASPLAAAAGAHPLAAFSEDGDCLAMLCAGNIVRCRDKTGRWHDLQGETENRVVGLTWLRDQLLVGQADGTLRTVELGETLTSQTVAQAGADLQRIASNGDSLVATAMANGQVELWNATTWEQEGNFWPGEPCECLEFVHEVHKHALARLGPSGQIEIRDLSKASRSRAYLPPGTFGHSFVLQHVPGAMATVRVFSSDQLLAESSQVLVLPCRFQGGRAGRQLSCTLDGKTVCTTDDILAAWQPRGAWSVGVSNLDSLKSVVAHIPRGNPAATGLEEADRAASQGKFSDSLDLYREQADSSATPDLATRQEALCKAVVCLAELGRGAEARDAAKRLLKSLSTDKDNVLYPYLLFWLCREYCRAKELDIAKQTQEIGSILKDFVRHYTLRTIDGDAGKQDVRHLIPVAIIAEISNWNLILGSAPANLIPSKELDKFIFETGEILNDSPLLQVDRELIMVEPQWATDDPALDGHLEHAVTTLNDYRSESPDPLVLHDLWAASERFPRAIERHSWRARMTLRRSLPELVSEMKQWIAQLEIQKIPAGSLLFLEMARLHHAKGEREQAEEILQKLLENSPNRVDFGFGYYAQALLMLGLLKEERGDAQGAREAWLRVKYTQWQEIALGHPERNRPEAEEEAFGRMYGFLAAVRSGEAVDDDCQRFLREVAHAAIDKKFTGNAARLLKTLALGLPLGKWGEYARQASEMPAARQLISDFLWKKKGFGDLTREVIRFGAAEVIKRDLHPIELSNDEDRLVTALAEAAVKMAVEKRQEFDLFRMSGDLATLFAMWEAVDIDTEAPKNVVEPVERLKDSLKLFPAEFHGPIAYLFAQRYMSHPETGQAMLDLASKYVAANPASRDDAMAATLRRLVASENAK